MYFLREGVLRSSLCTFTPLADEEVAALVVYNGGIPGFAGYDAPRAVLAFTRCRQAHVVFFGGGIMVVLDRSRRALQLTDASGL